MERLLSRCPISTNPSMDIVHFQTSNLIPNFIWKCMWKSKGPRIAIKLKGLFNGIKTFYRATTIITMWFWHKSRKIVQWFKIVSLETNPRTCGSAEQQGKRAVFPINGVGFLRYSYGKIWNFLLLPSICKNKLWLDCRSKILNIKQASRI